MIYVVSLWVKPWAFYIRVILNLLQNNFIFLRVLTDYEFNIKSFFILFTNYVLELIMAPIKQIL